MRWIEALKVWNRTKRECNPAHVWCTPRRDTPEHKEVKAIMERAKPEAVAKLNEERRADTLSRLRAEETKTMVRNYERRKEAEKLLAEAEARRAMHVTKEKEERYEDIEDALEKILKKHGWNHKRQTENEFMGKDQAKYAKMVIDALRKQGMRDIDIARQAVEDLHFEYTLFDDFIKKVSPKLMKERDRLTLKYRKD